MNREILSIKEFCKKTGLAEYVVRRLIRKDMLLLLIVVIKYIYIMN